MAKRGAKVVRECVVCGRTLRTPSIFCSICGRVKMSPENIHYWRKEAVKQGLIKRV